MKALHNFNFFLFEYANLCEQIDHLLIPALGPVLNAPEGKLKRGFFYSENSSNVFCLHHRGEI